VSIGALLPAIVGGAGTVLGPVLGSFVLTPLSELTRYALRGRAGADVMLYGAVLILVISFLPKGIMGLVREHGMRGKP
jgi:branched-chain amino acid transport system permease protein